VSSGTDIWRTWYIKHLVKGWLDGSITNNGMLLKPINEPATNGAWFESSDHDILNRRPQLVIEYYVP
jgi:hypothetical protein